MGNPKILNLDDLDLSETGIEIVHDGVKHPMRLLTVEMFIQQQKRQREHEKRVDAGGADEAEFVDAVELIRDSVKEFFPTLDVNGLPTPKLFRIFAFLNEITAKMNSESADDVVEETAEEAGNEASVEPTES
ncbi:hypothetical protein ACQKOE_07730 [Novosphingobium sp. NPDC080210]|uniref:hypothetical protein n=1 Tax=Novosphingobium sp. NPDC080210 TaxID=3390596 RepID=UPI003D06BD5A